MTDLVFASKEDFSGLLSLRANMDTSGEKPEMKVRAFTMEKPKTMADTLYLYKQPITSEEVKELIESLKVRFGEDIRIIKPSEMQDGEFRTSATMSGPNLPSQRSREESRKEFLEIVDYARQVKRQLQQACGYHGEGSIHFANAYFPEIFSERVEIWKGDIFAGSVGIDPSSGLLRINQGGDFGPMEWFEERTDSVFNRVSLDSIKESIGRYCLDEGIGIYGKSRTSNIQLANHDVSKSNDVRLTENISHKSYH